MEEITPEEAARQLAQLPPGALPGLERNLRRITHGLPRIDVSEEDDLMDMFLRAGEATHVRLDTGDPAYGGPQGVSKPISRKDWGAEQDGPQTVPLTIYIDEEKHIVGKATVIGRKVHAQIDPKDGRNLECLIREGIINGVTVSFSTEGPAHPALPFDQVTVGQDEEIKYNFEPTNPMKHIPMAEGLDLIKEKIKGLSVTHGIVDEITNTKES